jgi:hypothetical protein
MRASRKDQAADVCETKLYVGYIGEKYILALVSSGERGNLVRDITSSHTGSDGGIA